jgi:hypothetical protein
MLALILALIPQQPFPHEIHDSGIKVEYLGKAHLSQEEKTTIIKIVFGDQNPSECLAPGRTRTKELQAIRVARVALQTGQKTDLLIQTSDDCNCGGTGNCGFWILRSSGKGFDTLLETNMVQRFAVNQRAPMAIEI